MLELGNRRLQDRNRSLREDGERLRLLSETDPLTGAMNRRAFAEMLSARLDEYGDCEGAVALLDVDDMKLLNTHGGHGMGDSVLQTLSRVARALVREEDQIVRWGGDEFVVIACGLAPDELRRRLETLPDRLCADHAVEGAPAQWLGVSFGVAAFASLDRVETAIRHADAEMFLHKQSRKPDCHGDRITGPTRMKRPIPLLVACATLGLASAQASATATGGEPLAPGSSTGLHRCIDAAGIALFTDRPCDQMNATEAPAPSAGPAPSTVIVRTRTCARSQDDLLFGVRDALESHDPNRLAEYYHWSGMGNSEGYRLMKRLDAFSGRPLLDVQLVSSADPHSVDDHHRVPCPGLRRAPGPVRGGCLRPG